MKTFLISPDQAVYKANLHCHTIFSDGHLTPEQVKEEYRKRGYSIVAFSDHEYLIDHSDLSDDSFIAITATELQITDNTVPVKAHRKSTHLNIYARDPHNVTHIFFNKKHFAFGGKYFGKPELLPTLKYHGYENSERYHTVDCLNAIIKEARECGFIVSYNHPSWSLEDYSDYSGLKGLFAMEVFNTGAYKLGFTEYSNQVYDEMLRSGQRICCLATDDNHNPMPMEDPASDSFGGFTMVYPKEFTYSSIIEALENGCCFASTGPLFKEISFENDILHIECTNCSSVKLLTHGRRTETKWANEDTITRADFSICDSDVYFRIELSDKYGKKAFSRAYFLNELPIPVSQKYGR